MGTKSGRPKSFSSKSRNFLHFTFRPTRHGRQIAKYWGFRTFWPRAAFATSRNSGRETDKHNFRPPKKFSPKIRFFFYSLRFGRPHPQGREIVKCWFLRPFWPRTAFGTWKNLGPGRKTEKRNFPVLGALLGKQFSRPKKFPPTFRILTFIFHVLADPGAGNREILVF